MGVFWDGGFSACGMPWVPWSWRCGRLRPHLQEEGRLKEGHSGAYCGPTTGFKEEEEGLSVDETSSVGEVPSSDTESGVASVDVKEESEDGDCDGGGSDDGDLFQGFNDAPPLPAKIKKVAYRAPAAQLKTWQPTALYHSLAVKMFGFRSQFLKCCVPWLRQKVLMSIAVSSCTEGRFGSLERT